MEALLTKALEAIETKQETALLEEKAAEKGWWPPTAAWAAVYVTFVYVGVALLQWRAIGRQAHIAERTLTQEKIPYVFVKDVIHDLIFGSQGSVTIRYTLKNYGNGPAFLRSIIAQCVIDVRLEALPPVRTVDPPLSCGHIIGGGDEIPGPQNAHFSVIVQNDVKITNQDWTTLVEDPLSELKIFFFGLVNYTDLWGKEYTNGFAWIFDPNLKRMRIATNAEAPRYNYTL